MRRVIGVLMVALLVAACTGLDTDQATTPPTSGGVTTMTTTSQATETRATNTTNTTTTHPHEADDGTESVGVNDEVTIVITDPEDG